MGYGVTYPGSAPRPVPRLVRAMIDDAGSPGSSWSGTATTISTRA